MTKRQLLLFPMIFIAWLGLIFATSCTVIRPLEFFALIQHYLQLSETSIERFKVFWGLSWFIIVKGWHVTEFAVLTVLCVTAIRWWTGRANDRVIAASMLFCIVFAASDEWHQSFVPDRSGTISDVLIDTLGVCIAGIVMLSRQRKNVPHA